MAVKAKRGAEIGDKLRQLFKEKGTNAFSVAKAVGIDDGLLYKMLAGKREWKLRYLEAVLDHLGLPLEEFFGGHLEIPVVADFSATEMFPYPQTIPATGEKIRYRGKGSLANLKGMYTVRLKDDSMMPAFKDGTLFVCQKDTWDSIEDKDLVVAPNEAGLAQIYRVHFGPENYITLRSFNPVLPDRILPKNHIKLCDVVLETLHKTL